MTPIPPSEQRFEANAFPLEPGLRLLEASAGTGKTFALAQLVLQWDLAQDWQLLAATTAPLGSKGTEYGGIETGIDDLTLAVGPSLLVQLAWYF